MLEIERTDMNWVGSYDTYGINSFSLENYYNNGARDELVRWFSNLVISREKIGPVDFVQQGGQVNGQ